MPQAAYSPPIPHALRFATQRVQLRYVHEPTRRRGAKFPEFPSSPSFRQPLRRPLKRRFLSELRSGRSVRFQRTHSIRFSCRKRHLIGNKYTKTTLTERYGRVANNTTGEKLINIQYLQWYLFSIPLPSPKGGAHKDKPYLRSMEC